MNKRYLIFFLLFLMMFGMIIPVSANEIVEDGNTEATYKQLYPVTFAATVPPELASNYDKVSIQLVPDDGLPRTVYVAKQHDWTFITKLPEGNYIVYSADVPNDINEPFKIDEQLTFTVPTNDTVFIKVVSNTAPNNNDTDNQVGNDEIENGPEEIANNDTASEVASGPEDESMSHEMSDNEALKDTENMGNTLEGNNNRPSVIPTDDADQKDCIKISNSTTKILCFIAFLIGVITSSIFWIFILKKYRNNQY